MPRPHYPQRGAGGGQGQPRRGQGGDASTDEIIRFVRGYHLERESTWLRLQKRAPLPGIGQANHSMLDSSFPPSLRERRYSRTERDEDDNDDNDDDSCDEDENFLLDSEVSAIEAGQRDPFRHQFGMVDDLRFSSSFNAGTKRRDSRQLRPNASYGPPASQHRHVMRPLDSHGHVGGGSSSSSSNKFSSKTRARKSLGRLLKQLPPIAREELPERPSAPSPSLTPPGEGEELDSAGEPEDFIDAA